MIETLLNQNVCMYVMAAIGCLGILGRIFVNGYLRGLIKGTDNMGSTRKRALLEMRKKFEDIESLEATVNDVGSFADKYIDRLKLLNVPLSTWNGWIKNSFVVVAATGIFSAVYQYYVLDDRGEAVKLTVCCAATLTVMVAAWNQCDVAWSMRTLRSCTRNYLGNSLANRMRKEAKKQAELSAAVGYNTTTECGKAEEQDTVAEREAAASSVPDRKDPRKAKLRDTIASVSDKKEQESGAYDALLDTMMQRILSEG